MLDKPQPIALVTGASRGIGRAIAVALGQQGALVLGTATTENGINGINKIFAAEKIVGHGVLLDVVQANDCKTVVANLEKEHGSINILVNNAGITRDNLTLRMKEEEWDAVLDTNLKATYRLCKLVMPGMMKKRWGRIINIGSVVGSAGNPGQANYAAAKAGLGGLTRALAQELGSRNITVNCIAPGFIDTEMTRKMPQAQRDDLLSRIPLNRLGNVDEIARVVAFFASQSASYVTGSTIHVNGGMYMA